jgi:eukaryotic-like serine/threonine-protein kinase
MSAQPAAAEIVGNYMIERSLAQGSMGHVYVARHQLTYARVALKVLRPELAADAHAEERFLREVRAAAQIGHDGIVKVLDAGCDHLGRLYLAMELLAGETLEERMTREAGDRVALMRWIALALPPLAAAHAQGIIHRDLKPANLFIAVSPDGSEQLKLLDFGLARDTRQKSRTETGVALGTPYYMSPEQAMRPKEVGPATDVWALGVMMYEVLAGQMPFDGETLHAVVLQSSTRPHVPLATRQPDLDPALCELVESCLCKDPDLRPHDASALMARLYPLLEDPGVHDQLEQPISMARVVSERTPRAAAGFADTAITLPAPRLDESEASYPPRRSANAGVLIPAVLSVALAGGAIVGYLRFAPASHLRDEQPVQVQQQQAAVSPPAAAAAPPVAAVPAAAPVAPVAEAPTPPPAAAAVPPPSAAPQEPVADTRAGTSARAQAAQSSKANKRNARGKRTPSRELPLPDALSIADPSAPEMNNPPAPQGAAPEAPASADEWDKIDKQVRALPGQDSQPEHSSPPIPPEAIAPEANPEADLPSSPFVPEWHKPNEDAVPQPEPLPPDAPVNL